MSEDARKVRPLSLEGQGRVGLRLRTSSGGDDPPSPSTPSLLDTSLLDTSSQPRKRTSTGASRSKRIMWSTQNSIIQSFSTGSHGTMTVSWEACPRTVLIVKKWKSEETAQATAEIGEWLEARGMRVFVQFEEEELDTELAKRFDRFDACACSALGGAVELLRSPSGTHLNLEASLAEEAEGAEGSASSCSPASRGAGVAAPIDFIVCLGGDGTMIFASSLFPFAIPPMVSFNLGSLGFLTPFSVKEYAATLERLLTSHDGGRPVPIELRMRLEGSVLRHDAEVGAREEPVVILNEVLVDRGPTAYMTMIDAYVNGAFLTTVQADGIIIATPTGSTAYSLSAGGPIVAPSVPCILFTPVCPHTLSFRPLIFPDSAVIRLQVPADARHSAWVSFDGKGQTELRVGDAVEIRMSESPLPVITRSRDPDAGTLSSKRPEWIASIDKKLGWNVRERHGTRKADDT